MSEKGGLPQSDPDQSTQFPNDVVVKCGLANLLRKGGQCQEAKRLLSSVKTLNKTHRRYVEVLMALIISFYLKAPQFEEASQFVKSAQLDLSRSGSDAVRAVVFHVNVANKVGLSQAEELLGTVSTRV